MNVKWWNDYGPNELHMIPRYVCDDAAKMGFVLSTALFFLLETWDWPTGVTVVCTFLALPWIVLAVDQWYHAYERLAGVDELSRAERSWFAGGLCVWWSIVFWVIHLAYGGVEDAAADDGFGQTLWEVLVTGSVFWLCGMVTVMLAHLLHDSEAHDRYEEHLRNPSASPAASPLLSNNSRPEGHRGSRIMSMEQARSMADGLWGQVNELLLWGGIRVAEKIAVMHFLVVGAPGSGKTLMLRMLMRFALVRIQPGSGHRAIVYDAKQDAKEILNKMGLTCRTILANPRDARSSAWDIARDCTSQRIAKEIARVFIPEDESQNRFFSDAASDLLAGVMAVLLLTAPGRWTLRDVVLAIKNKRNLKALLASRRETEDLLEYFAEPRTLANILSTLKTRMSAFEAVAAAWSRCSTTFSLHEWMTGTESILVLGNDESSRVAIDAINRVLFKRASELVLAQSESSTRRIWFFLDEVREAGKLDGLSRLMTKGRSKGAAVVLGFQDVNGMRAVYGDKEGDELIGQCSTKALLRSASPETAEWQSRAIGEREQVELSKSKTQKYAFQTESNTLSEQMMRRANVLPSEFMSIPPTSFENGLSGFFITPEIGVWHGTIEGAEIDWILSTGIDNAKDVPGFVPRPVEEELLRPWDLEDVRRLGLYGPGYLRQADSGDGKSTLKIVGQPPQPESPKPESPNDLQQSA